MRGGSRVASPRKFPPGQRVDQPPVPALRPVPLQPGRAIDRGAGQHHDQERVVLELRLPPQRIAGRQHPLGQQRQHRDHHRGGERQEAERREQADHGAVLHPRGDEHVERVQRVGEDVQRGAAERGPELAVGPVEGRRPAERGNQHARRHPGRGQPADNERQAGPPPPGEKQVPAEPRNEQPHVLLDQEQHDGGQDPVPAPVGVKALHHDGGQHGDEGGLVEVEDDRGHDREGQGVRDGYQVRRRLAEPPPCVEPQRRDGKGEQHALRDEQGRGAVVDPVQRGEQRQDR